MEEILSALVGAVNLVLWDYLLIYALIGIGLFFTLYLGAPQITKLGTGFKSVFGGLFSKKDKDHEGKSLSQFQALAVAISAQIGTGNVAGVATAITAGGPGAIFWMWLSAILGMSTIFAEAVFGAKIPRGQPRQIHRRPCVLHHARPDPENRPGRGAFPVRLFLHRLDYRAGFHRQRNPIQLHRLGHEFGF